MTKEFKRSRRNPLFALGKPITCFLEGPQLLKRMYRSVYFVVVSTVREPHFGEDPNQVLRRARGITDLDLRIVSVTVRALDYCARQLVRGPLREVRIFESV